jgi:23S rRNA (cytosine1962-C5)-methyltransferase
MTAKSVTASRDVVLRLFPVLWEDADFLAIGKPARVNLESAAWPHGPRVIDLVAESLATPRSRSRDDRNSSLHALVLPERLSSGVALFARSDEARHRFAGMAASNRLVFTHTAVVRGAPPRRKIAVKPGGGARGRKSLDRTAAAPASARVDLLASTGDLHVARCTTKVAGLDDVRRMFKAAGGLEIVGDIRPSPYADKRRTSPARRPIVHLELLAFPHPFKQREATIADPVPRAFQSYLTSHVLLEEHLRSALAARLALVLDEETDAFRLFTGPNEGIGGLVAEQLAGVVVLETLEGRFDGGEQQLRQIGNWYAHTLGVRTVYARGAPRQRSGAGPAASAPEVRLLKGTEVEELVVREHGVCFLARPGSGGSVGLFLDQRENRRRIAQLCAGKDLLNLFAHTCGFSVAAAAAGAKSTTSVDLSAGSLAWGKENFAANGIALDDHTFIRSDAFEYFKRARRQERRFDVIVLDPPTFARAKKPRRTFEIKRHLGELITASAELLRPGGHLLVSTNYRQMLPGALRARIEDALADRLLRIVALPKLPIDFAADPDYQKAVLVRLR